LKNAEGGIATEGQDATLNSEIMMGRDADGFLYAI
jgi:hypothetical protein